jgi:hypothetical protein
VLAIQRNIRDRLMATAFEQSIHEANPDHQSSRLDPRLMLGGHVEYGHTEHTPSGSVKAFHDKTQYDAPRSGHISTLRVSVTFVNRPEEILRNSPAAWQDFMKPSSLRPVPRLVLGGLWTVIFLKGIK